MRCTNDDASMNKKHLKRQLLLILLLVLTPAMAMAGDPTDHIKAATDRLITIISDNSLKTPEMKGKREQMIMETADGLFSWEEFSKRALAKNWNKRTPEERKAFVSLVRQLIADTYMDKTYQYAGESIIFQGEKIEGDHGNVTSRFKTSTGAQVPVKYCMIKKDGKWRVYDISIEGVSLVSNYRSQFNSIIKSSSYEDLVKQLKEKLKKRY
jgi:phospholipid transport system substrate-binding protein